MKGIIKSATKVVSRVSNAKSRTTESHIRSPSGSYAIGAAQLRSTTVHRLVAEYFLEDWNPRLEVNHLDGNRYNNAADNLEMCTHQRNMEHAIANNLKWDYGEKSPNAKLTNAEAEAIRVAYHAGGATQEKLAQQYSVSRQTVSDIINYKKYIR